MNKQIEVTKVLTSPKRRAIQPDKGCMIAAASMYELTAQVPSDVLTPRLPEMAGTETLTMVMSRISMNVAKAMAAVRNSNLPPCKGGYSNAPAAWVESAIQAKASDRRRDFGARSHRLPSWLLPNPAYRPACRPRNCR